MRPRPRLPATTRKTLLVLLLAVAAAIRVVHLVQVAEGTPHFEAQVADCAYYDAWALEGAPDTAFYQPPLYPTLLRGLYAVLEPQDLLPDRFLVVAILQSLLGLASLYLVVSIGRKVASDAAGFLGGALFLLHANALFWEVHLLIAPLALVLGLLAIRLLVGAVDGGSLRAGRTGWAGLVAGLLCIARADRVLFLPLALGWTLAVGGRRRWSAAACFCLGAALPIGAVFTRNVVVADDPVPISANGGVNFHFGNHAGASGLNMGPSIEFGALATQRETAKALAEEAEGTTLSDAEVSAHWFRRGVTFWRERPGEALQVLGRKARLAIADLETEIGWMAEAEEPFVPLYRFLPVSFSVLLGLGAAGLLFYRPRRRGAFLVSAAILASALVLLVFFMGSRFRLPAVPSLAILGGAALAGTARDLRARRFLRPAAGAVVAAGLCVLSLRLSDAARIPGHEAPLKDLLLANTTYLVGEGFFDAGDIGAARAAFRRVLDHDPESGKAKLALGDCAYRQAVDLPLGVDDEERRRRLEIAQRNYVQARTLLGALPAVHERLGDVALDPAARDAAAAVPHYETATRLSDAPEHHAKLVRALLLAGREEDARRALAEFERRHPGHPRAATLAEELSRP